MNEPTTKRQLIVDLPEEKVAPAEIHVSPEITIEIPPPIPRAYDCVVTARDENGFMLSFRITPDSSP
jgi:hypothetical protein